MNVLSLFFNVMLLTKSVINIISSICFARNGLLIASHISGFAYDTRDCSEKSILAKENNDSIYVSKGLCYIIGKCSLLQKCYFSGDIISVLCKCLIILFNFMILFFNVVCIECKVKVL
jgi:hypothetical protein